MKRSSFILVGLSVGLVIQAQVPNANEMFRQKKTQRQYSADQVIALKAYLQVLKKGYAIVQKGLDEVGSSKNQTYSRDQEYFNSLKEVSSVVRSSPRIKQIYACQQKIRNEFSKLDDDSKTDKNLTKDERNYIHRIYLNMIKECEFSLDELTLTAASSTEMTDAERLQRLDQITESVLDKLAFTQHFVSSTRALSIARAKEKSQTEALKRLHGKP